MRVASFSSSFDKFFSIVRKSIVSSSFPKLPRFIEILEVRQDFRNSSETPKIIRIFKIPFQNSNEFPKFSFLKILLHFRNSFKCSKFSQTWLWKILQGRKALFTSWACDLLYSSTSINIPVQRRYSRTRNTNIVLMRYRFNTRNAAICLIWKSQPDKWWTRQP